MINIGYSDLDQEFVGEAEYSTGSSTSLYEHNIRIVHASSYPCLYGSIRILNNNPSAISSISAIVSELYNKGITGGSASASKFYECNCTIHMTENEVAVSYPVVGIYSTGSAGNLRVYYDKLDGNVPTYATITTGLINDTIVKLI